MEPQDEATQLALARYAVVAPLTSRQMTKAEYQAEARRITELLHQFPGGKLKRVSPRNLRRWVQWYRKGRVKDGRVVPPGLDALKPLPRDDRGVPRALNPELVNQAIRLRAEEPTRTTASLVDLLKAQAVGRGEEPPIIEEATLAYHLRARRATRKVMKQDGKVYPRYEHAHRNDCWQGDMTGGLWVPNPQNPKKLRECHLHAFIDDRTRYVTFAQFYFRQNQTCLMDCFRKAVLAGGLCSIAYWDNGPAYRSAQVEMMAARLGIQVVFATPYHPQGKGKIERFFGVMKESFYPEARRANLQSIEELNEFFWAWLDRYHNREHSELKTTPRVRWEAEAAHARWPDPAVLADAFLWEAKRRVDKAGCVHLEGNSYPVPEHLAGAEVSLCFDPFDLAKVRVFHKGVYVDTVAPQELTSNTFRKATSERPEKPSPLDSATTYRTQMSDNFRQRIKRIVDPSGPRDAGTDCLTRVEFAALLSEHLPGRRFTTEENTRMADFFLRHAPLQKHLVHDALQTAVEEKGTHRHLRFYLDAVRSSRLDRKGDQ